MKFLCLCIVFAVCVVSPVQAQTNQNKRRIEEEKREILLPSQSQSPSERKKTASPGQTTQERFFRELLIKDTATVSDVYEVLTILAGYQDRYTDFTGQHDFLKVNSILPKTMLDEDDPGKPIQKGPLAYMLCKLLDIRGGLLMRLTGLSKTGTGM